MINRSMSWIIIVTVTLVMSVAQVSYSQKPFEPYMVKDLVPTAGSHSVIEEVTIIGDVFFFRSFTLETGLELWKSDGTPEGTVLVKDIHPGPEDSNPMWLTDVNGTLFFSADDGVHARELWKSDGTEAGTVMVRDRVPGSRTSDPEHLVNFNGIVLYQDNTGGEQNELHRSDGTELGTYQVADINPGICPLGNLCNSTPKWLTKINETVYFVARREDVGDELWKSDGTLEGTVIVKDIKPGGCNGLPPPYYRCESGFYTASTQELLNVGGILYFIADDGVHGWELWRSDGTDGGTYMVKEIDPTGSGTGDSPGRIRDLTNVNETLYFLASDGSGTTLWRCDGTEEGTVPIGPSELTVTRFSAHNGEIWFSGRTNIYPFDYQLWKSDGTAEGNYLVKGSTSFSSPLAFYRGEAVWQGIDGLMRSDGTAEGTYPFVTGITSLRLTKPGKPYNQSVTFWNLSDKLYFAGDDYVHGSELWMTDLTADDTVMLKDLNPTAGSHAGITEMADADGTLFFMARTNDRDTCGALYKSDGTAEGTVAVKIDQCNAEDPAFGQKLAAIGDVVYSYGYVWPTGEALFRSDGTSEGTEPYFFFENDARVNRNLNRVGDYLFFETRHWEDHGGGNYVAIESIWRTDGTPEGTIVLASFLGDDIGCDPSATRLERRKEDFVESNGTVFLNYCNPQYGWELWKTNGKPEGTSMVKDINPGTRNTSGAPYHGNPQDITDVNGTLYFRAYTENEGAELWKSDGTTAGTVMVSDLWPGIDWTGKPFSSSPNEFSNVNGKLYFSADNGFSLPLTNEIMLWSTDGTAEGTRNHNSPFIFGHGSYAIPYDIAAFKGSAFFSTIPGRLWKTTGSGYDTEFVKQLESSGASARVRDLIDVNGTLFFGGTYGDPPIGAIWMTDGTEQGTTPLAPTGSTSINSGGTLYFIGKDPSLGFNLWAIRTTVFVDRCNTGVPEKLYEGKYITTWIEECADSAKNHGNFVSCVAHLTNDLKKDGEITGKEKGAIQSCAAQSDIP